MKIRKSFIKRGDVIAVMAGVGIVLIFALVVGISVNGGTMDAVAVNNNGNQCGGHPILCYVNRVVAKFQGTGEAPVANLVNGRINPPR